MSENTYDKLIIIFNDRKEAVKEYNRLLDYLKGEDCNFRFDAFEDEYHINIEYNEQLREELEKALDVGKTMKSFDIEDGEI